MGRYWCWYGRDHGPHYPTWRAGRRVRGGTELLAFSRRGFARLVFSTLRTKEEPMAEVRRVGMLTGGGDAPGLNGVIRAVTTKCVEDYGYEVVGLKRGWKALLDPEPDT